MKTAEKVDLVVKHLGHMGKMLSPNKRAPEGHVVFWNGNVYDKDGTKLWYGDVNITRQGKALSMLADDLGEHFYVTKESPFRWSEQTTESLERAWSEVNDDRMYHTIVKVRP